MTDLWPQLPHVVAAQVYAQIDPDDAPRPAVEHPQQVFAPVGGRVAPASIRTLIDRVTSLAETFGFPDSAGTAERIAFDRECAPVVKACMDISWAEAGNRGVWSFISLIALPHVTAWRFGGGNPERWLASDLTRHTWARLWWQAVVFADDPGLLKVLSESDLNQLLERRSIGGDPRLVQAVGRAVTADGAAAVPRRYLIRDVALRLNRWLAFLDVRALSDAQLREMCNLLSSETIERYSKNEQAPDRP